LQGVSLHSTAQQALWLSLERLEAFQAIHDAIAGAALRRGVITFEDFQGARDRSEQFRPERIGQPIRPPGTLGVFPGPTAEP
jgi:hypothetical protein